MKYWFGLNSEELYENSERLNSDVCFFISKTANEVHSGIHIYSEGIKDKNLRNILTDGEVIASHITEDYYLPEHGNEVDTDNFIADNNVYFEKCNARLELTTDTRAKILEKRIEKEILHDIVWKRIITYIQAERVWNVSYFFEIL